VKLIHRLQNAQNDQQHTLAVKPQTDTRSGGRLASHVQSEFPATEVGCAAEILSLVHREPHVDVVGIDEAQFFDSDIVPVCQSMVDRGIRVIVAGLDLDYRGVPFGSMPQLLALADKFLKLTAICTVCGGEATRSQRLTESTEQIECGAKAEYAARCHEHFTPPKES